MTGISADPDALFAVGNGRMLAYLQGPNAHTAYGPRYSSPRLFSARWLVDGWAEEDREAADGVATFAFENATLECFTEPDAPALTYSWTELASPQHIVVAPSSSAPDSWHRLRTPGAEAWITEIRRGELVYMYPSASPHYVAVVSPHAEMQPAGSNDLIARIAKRSGWLSIVAGTSFAEVVEQVGRLLGEQVQERIQRARAGALSRLDQMRELSAPPGLRRVLRSAAQQICAQQSEDGGIIAGHNYALAYVRDQFGTCEGLLALGLYDSAKRNIYFRYEKWRRFGTLANAEAMSDEAIRHSHENDDVELTAYTVLQILRYAQATGEWGVIDELAPMIQWCMESQTRHLAAGAIPFNGDETYIAGGILPRWAMLDGSLEATILYHASIRALQAHAGRPSLAILDWARMQEDAQEIEAHFASNFLRGSEVVTNSLRRRASHDAPSSRNGVCEHCYNFPTVVIRRESGRYTCWRCDTNDLEPPHPQELRILSATLFSALVPSTLIPDELEAQLTLEALEAWSQGHSMPPQGDGEASVGYDEGLLLRGLVRSGRHEARNVAEALLERADRHGMWSEYYAGGQPTGTRCRPWESGMNLAALILELDSRITTEGSSTRSQRRRGADH